MICTVSIRNNSKEVFKLARFNTKKIAGLGLITAMVIVLQFVGSFIKFGPFSISLVLIPIVVGAALYGWQSGIWLGLVFGVIVLISGDAAAFLAVNPLGTIVTVIIKGIAAGAASGAVYGLLKKVNKYFAVAVSAIVCPLANTGVFLIGCKLFFMPLITEWAAGAGFNDNVGLYMIVGLVGLNFVFEMLVNILLSPIILRLINLGSRKRI